MQTILLPLALFALSSYSLAQESSGISVSGTATRYETPDVAMISLGVSKMSAKLGSAKSDADAAMARVQEAVRKAGVSVGDIQTSDYRIFAVPASKTTPRQWKVAHEITIKVRKVQSASVVLDGAVSAGATDVSQISYALENMVAARSKARVEAMRVARQKGEELAKLGGVALGPVLSISESGEGGFYGQTANFAGYQDNAFIMGSSSSQVRSGQISVVVSVQVRFAIGRE